MPIQVLEADAAWTGGNTGGGGTPTGGGAPTTWSDATVPETGTLQILLGEGRMEGLVSQNGIGTDCLRSVLLDNTPVQNSDGTFNFTGLAMALVAGTNTQPSIKGITGTESETSVNVQVVQATPVVRSVTSNPSAVRVRISIPALKKISTSDGKESGNVARVKIERQNAGYNGGAWQEVTLDNSGIIEGGPFSTKFTKSFRVETPATGTWQIRVTRVTADDPDAYSQSQTWWDAITEIVDARLRYPNRSIFSIRLNAKQFRSIPRVNLHMRGSILQVPANYTPASYNWVTKTWTAATYATTGPGTSGGAWDGTFKDAWCNSPAWGFFQAASNTIWGAGTFLAASGLDKWSLYTISQWCDAMVADGKGGTEPRMVCNLYMQNPQNAIKALGQLASIFWGVIYYASGLVVPVPDADTAPVALFTNANVEGGHFRYEGTARSARHTAAVASFINPDLGYAQDTAIYEDEDGIARYGYNALDIQAIGATSQGQALRLAKWTILTELMSPEVVAFASGLEGSTVKPGDVVQVADQFRAGAARMGGRIVATATTTVIPLDAPVTLGAGAYTLRCQTDTGMESRTVTTAAGTVSSLTVSPAFSSAPALGSGWLLQAGTTASLWRVLSVKKAEGIKFEVVALKHDPAKYAALGLASGDVVPRTPRTISAPAPAGLAVTSTTRILNDRQQLTLNANWTLDGAVSYIAQASRDYGPWESMTVSGASAYLDGIQPGSWRVRVCGDWRGAGTSTYATVTATVTASGTVPPWVSTAQSTANTALSTANAAVSAAATAQSTADGKIDTFWQPTPPGSASEGDLWFDTDDGNKVYRWTSGAWGAAQDSGIAAAISAASTAQGTADGKARIYYQTAQPTGLGAGDQGDLWCDTDDNYKLWAWTGSAWQLAQDWQAANAAAAAAQGTANSAASAAATAQASANAVTATVADITADDKVTAPEKMALKPHYDSIISEQAGIDAQADSFSVSRATYDTNVNNLASYATSVSLWASMTATTDLGAGGGAVFRGYIESVLTSRQAVLNAIYAAAKAKADGAQSTGNTALTNAAYANTLARDNFNLVKNGNSSNSSADPSTPEGLGLYNSGAVSVLAPAKWARLLTATTSGVLNVFTALIPCVQGDQFMAQCQGTFATTTTGGDPRIVLAWFNAAGEWFASDPSPAITAANSNYAAPSTIRVSGTAPAGAVGVKVCAYTDAIGAGTLQYVVNNFFACRKISAGMLEALLAIVGTIQSDNYVAGTSSTPATGFWLSGTAATKTALGGATYSVQFELGTSALFGGYLVGDMTKRAQPINRIRNGSFYLNLGEWTATGGVAYSASSATAGTGSAALSASTATYDVTGTLSQSFSMPGLFTGQVATLALKTALVTNSNNGDTCSVTAYLLNQSTGTETNLGTWSYATNNQTLSWTARSVDITSQVSSGGDFSLRLDLRVSNTNGIARTSTIYVDEIKIQA
jgi:predicted phage tail protein